MVEEALADTFTHTLGGRDIVFRTVTLGMMTASRRYLLSIQNRIEAAAGNLAAQGALWDDYNEALLDVIDSRFINSDDQTWVAKQLMLGNLVISDLYPILLNGATAAAPVDDDADVARKPAGRKTAAKKPAKKAPAKTANSSRVKR